MNDSVLYNDEDLKFIYPQSNDCQALLCHEVTETNSLFCGYHRESGESLYAPDVSDEQFLNALSISFLPDDDFKLWMILKFVVLYRRDRLGKELSNDTFKQGKSEA